MRKPKEVVQALLEGIHDPSVVKELCTPDVTYVSLNYSNPDLKRLCHGAVRATESMPLSRLSMTLPSSGKSTLSLPKIFLVKTIKSGFSADLRIPQPDCKTP